MLCMRKAVILFFGHVYGDNNAKKKYKKKRKNKKKKKNKNK